MLNTTAASSGGNAPTNSNNNAAIAGALEHLETLRARQRSMEQMQARLQEASARDLQRQRREHDTLRRENDSLKQQINELRASEVTQASSSTSTGAGGGGGLFSSGGGSSGRGTLKSAHGARRSKELDSKRDTLQHLEIRLSEAQQRSADLEEQHEANRAAIKEQRRQMGGVNATRDNAEAVEKQVTVLENRLDQSLVRFNNVLKENKELRDAIDTLRGERDVFETIYQKLEGELQDRKKEMAFIIEVANIAYEERDNNAQVLQSLKAYAADEMNTFAATFAELDGLMETDRKTKEQVKERIAGLERRELQRTQDAKARSALKASALAEQNSGNIAVESQTQAYEEAFVKLRQATEVPDLGALVQRFLTAEEENYSLFSFVNTLAKTIEGLEEQRASLLEQIDNTADGNDEDKARRTQLRSLEDKLRAEERANQQFVDLTNKANGVLRGIMAAVEGLFARCGCDDSNIMARHGVSGLSSESLLLYLAAVEERAEQYMRAWAVQTGQTADGAIDTSRGPLVPMNAKQIVISEQHLPTTGEDADLSDHDDHPLTREELLRRVQRRMKANAQMPHARSVRAGGIRSRGVGLKK